LHLNPWQLITAFLIGIFSGWLYYKTNKLSLSIFIHFVNNLAAYLVMQFDDTPIEEIANMSLIDQYSGLLNFIGITISAIIILLMCLHLLRNEFNKEISANHS